VNARKTAIKGIATAFLRRHVLGETAMQPWIDGAKITELQTSKVLWDGTLAKPACM
jgi:hypothetical protein